MKQEPEYKFCSECKKPFGFINCRVTIQYKGVHHVCLSCYRHVKERLKTKNTPVAEEWF